MHGTGKKPDLEIKGTGTLHIPFSQRSFADLLLWLKGGQEDDCPIDLDTLPDSTSPLSEDLKNNETFYIFREVKVEENDENKKQIVFVYDRMKVEDGGAKESPETGDPSRSYQQEDYDEIINNVSSMMYDKHQIALSKSLLSRLRRENPTFQEAEDEGEFIDALEDHLDLFPEEYQDHTPNEPITNDVQHLGEKET